MPFFLNVYRDLHISVGTLVMAGQAKQAEEKKEKAKKHLWELDRYESWSDVHEVDPREVYTSWSDFIKQKGYKSPVIDDSPLLWWVWRLPILEREDLGYTAEEVEDDEIFSAEEHQKDTLFLYYFQTKYEDPKASLVIFKIAVKKEDEPEIRTFIEKYFATPFGRD